MNTIIPSLAAVIAFGIVVAQWHGMRRAARRRRARRHDAALALDRRLCHSIDEFESLVDAELARARVVDRDVLIATFDIDELGSINERYGMSAGDAMIDLTERLLMQHLRRVDTVCALGDGAWLVACPDVTDPPLYAADLRHHVATALASATQELDVELPRPRISVGASSTHDDYATSADLLQISDLALGGAKLCGGDCTRAWDYDTRLLVRPHHTHRRSRRDPSLDTVLALAEALDMRDADAADHSRMVGDYAEMMAEQLGLAPAHVERIRIAGLLHDIGKIGIPDSVLRKPAALTDEEYEQMKQHPVIGARLLASIGADDLRAWTLAHHERPDGRGYPLGLADSEIGIEAKILAVADAWEAMTADRVYRAAPGPEFARAELLRGSGSQFDPVVVTAFLEVLDSTTHQQAPTPTLTVVELPRASAFGYLPRGLQVAA